MNKVLVTGGAGFIGQGVCRALMRRGIQPVILDRHRHPVLEGCEVIYGDVRDAGAVEEAVYHTDGFIHLAAVLGTQETVPAPHHVAETNIMGALNVFKAAHTREKRGVYIAVGNHWMNNPYSITKTTAERFAFMYNRELGTKFAVVRGLNVYGPGQKAKPVRKVVPNLILPALKNEPITIYGDGTQIMDMIHIRDISEILVRALVMQHGVYDRVFEAGMGDDTTVNDLANLIIEEAGSTSVLDHVPMRPGELPNSIVKADPMTLAPLDYLPERMIPLRAGIAETIKWYR